MTKKPVPKELVAAAEAMWLKVNLFNPTRETLRIYGRLIGKKIGWDGKLAEIRRLKKRVRRLEKVVRTIRRTASKLKL